MDKSNRIRESGYTSLIESLEKQPKIGQKTPPCSNYWLGAQMASKNMHSRKIKDLDSPLKHI